MRCSGLSDNGPQYTATASVLYAHELGLVPITTPAYSPESNGLAEGFVHTFKRDYVSVHELHDAETGAGPTSASGSTTTTARRRCVSPACLTFGLMGPPMPTNLRISQARASERSSAVGTPSLWGAGPPGYGAQMPRLQARARSPRYDRPGEKLRPEDRFLPSIPNSPGTAASPRDHTRAPLRTRAKPGFEGLARETEELRREPDHWQRRVGARQLEHSLPRYAEERGAVVRAKVLDALAA